jgi:hypothetical protein
LRYLFFKEVLERFSNKLELRDRKISEKLHEEHKGKKIEPQRKNKKNKIAHFRRILDFLGKCVTLKTQR